MPTRFLRASFSVSRRCISFWPCNSARFFLLVCCLARNSACLCTCQQGSVSGMDAGIDQLFSSNSLVLYCLLVVRSSASGAETVYVVLDVVKAELAHLDVGRGV